MNPLPRFAILALVWSASAVGQVTVLTNRYDFSRTGANLAETVLTASNVNTAQFGKLWTYAVDGSVYAQPLYVQGLNLPGHGFVNVLYVATMNDKLYALNADSNQTLWVDDFTSSGAGIAPVPIGDVAGTGTNIVGNVGIESTPVIDLASRTLYLVTRTKEPGPSYAQRLHAIDLITGAEKFGGPTTITATFPTATGSLAFDVKAANQRAALALSNGLVIVCWASHQDIEPYHGWVMAFSETTLQQVSALNLTPNGMAGAIWQSGCGPAVDSSGNLYVITGNGDWDGVTNFGDSFLKLGGRTGLPILDWFTPDNQSTLNTMDLDLGATAPMLIPGTPLMLGGGKGGMLYLIHTGQLGHMQQGNGQIVQVLADSPTGQNRSTPVYWNSPTVGPLIYEWPMNDVLKVYHFNGSTIDVSPVAQGTVTAQNPGAMLVLSANGSAVGSGVLWASMPLSASAGSGVVAGILRAYDASNPGGELWDSQQNASRDSIGSFAKFNPPTLANGRLYMATFSSAVAVYGLLAAPPVFSGLPVAQAIANGSSVAFTAVATGTPAPAYQWRLNGTNIPGATNATLLLAGASASSAGTYTCVASNANGSSISTPAVLTVSGATNPGRLVNLSALGPVNGTTLSLSVGFVSGGAGTSGLQPLLLRGMGPSLAGFGLSGVLSDPLLTLYSGASVYASNDNWAGSAAVTAADSAVGAFALANASSLDAALVESLPSGSSYSAVVTGQNGTAGLSLAEIYDATSPAAYAASSPRLTNLSCLSRSSPGAPLAAGFTIGGGASRTVLVRASGPALAPFGVSGTLPDPQLAVYAAGTGTMVVASNAGWAGDPQITAAANTVHAFPFANAASKDSAVLVTLAPGSYSAQVTSASGASGAALVEVYEVP